MGTHAFTMTRRGDSSRVEQIMFDDMRRVLFFLVSAVIVLLALKRLIWYMVYYG